MAKRHLNSFGRPIDGKRLGGPPPTRAELEKQKEDSIKQLRQSILDAGGVELLNDIRESFRRLANDSNVAKEIGIGVGTLIESMKRIKAGEPALIVVASIDNHDHRRAVAATLQEILDAKRKAKP